MTEIIPAVLVKSYDDLREKISRFSNYVDIIQIDMCDGKFVPSISWPMQTKDEDSILNILNEEEGLPAWDHVDFEFDLMIKNAHTQFEFFTRLGAKRLVFHFEAEDKEPFKEFLESMDPYWRDNLEIGLSINTTTDIEEIKPFINLIDFIQCMGIEKPGFQGEPFDERVINQIKKIKELYPETIVSIDGSVNEDTAPLLVEAGANRLVIGSALNESYDIEETIKEFENLSSR